MKTFLFLSKGNTFKTENELHINHIINAPSFDDAVQRFVDFLKKNDKLIKDAVMHGEIEGNKVFIKGTSPSLSPNQQNFTIYFGYIKVIDSSEYGVLPLPVLE